MRQLTSPGRQDTECSGIPFYEPLMATRTAGISECQPSTAGAWFLLLLSPGPACTHARCPRSCGRAGMEANPILHGAGLSSRGG